MRRRAARRRQTWSERVRGRRACVREGERGRRRERERGSWRASLGSGVAGSPELRRREAGGGWGLGFVEVFGVGVCLGFVEYLGEWHALFVFFVVFVEVYLFYLFFQSLLATDFQIGL